MCTELTAQPNRRLVHLVNYRKEQPVLHATVTVRLPSTRRATSVRLASPEHDNQPTVQFTQSENTAQFRVPRVGIYEIAVVELAAVSDSTSSKRAR